MIKQIGTKVYYCKITGNVIKIIGDSQGYVEETNLDQDYEVYMELKERDKITIGLLQYEYGIYSNLSKDSTGCHYDLTKQELVFTYEELPITPQEPTEIEVIQNKISTLEAEKEQLKKINQEQDQMLVDNAYKITILEMNMGGM